MAERRHRAPNGLLRRLLITLLVAGAVAGAWSGVLDRAALDNTLPTFQRALATFALARALNAVISVAQGTELAIQPVGVGVSLGVGQILDPLNDLIESFSWLALLACVSLGVQLLLTEALVSDMFNAAISAAGVLLVLALWLPAAAAARSVLLRAFIVLIFVRFLFAVVALTTAWVDQTILAERQIRAMQQIEITQSHLEEMQEEAPPLDAPAEADDSSLLQRFGAFLDDRRQAMNVEAQLDALTERVENAIEEVIHLLVVFTVQTILVPVGALVLAWWGLLALLRSDMRLDTRPGIR
jgi:ABC-type multidrug transport system fused ATPase/permease subunit